MRLAACTLLLAAAAAPVQAADSLLLAGSSDSPLGSYSYLGALVPLGQGSLGQGWVMRQWVDRITYHYDGYVPDIHALDYGYSPALGYQWAIGGGQSHAALYGGVRVAHTNLDPDDPSNVDRGTRVRVTLQGELTSELGARAENQFLAEGEIGNGAYFVRDRLQWRFLGHYTLGPEAIVQGSRVYQAHEAGVFLGGIAITRRANLLLRAGVYQQRDQPTVGTAGIELAATF
jgi:Cellulose biosynthesis protein BcsS